MKLEKAAKKYLKIKRSSWPNKKYLHKIYIDNGILFVWKRGSVVSHHEANIPLTDALADDWEWAPPTDDNPHEQSHTE